MLNLQLILFSFCFCTELEKRTAALLGKEDGVFVPSGTMSNLAASEYFGTTLNFQQLRSSINWPTFAIKRLKNFNIVTSFNRIQFYTRNWNKKMQFPLFFHSYNFSSEYLELLFTNLIKNQCHKRTLNTATIIIPVLGTYWLNFSYFSSRALWKTRLRNYNWKQKSHFIIRANWCCTS